MDHERRRSAGEVESQGKSAGHQTEVGVDRHVSSLPRDGGSNANSAFPIDAHVQVVSRLGTAHRLATLRHTGVLGRRYGTVIDIGGFDGAVCARFNAAERIVVEPFPPSEEARASQVRFVIADGAASALAGGCADLVLLLDVLEHVAEPRSVLAEAFRLLGPSGSVVATVPSRHIRIFPWFLQSWADRRWGHTMRRGFTSKELSKLVEESGGETVRSIDLGSVVFRTLYLPLSALWRSSPFIASRLLDRLSGFDFRFRNVGAGHGYIFVELKGRA